MNPRGGDEPSSSSATPSSPISGGKYLLQLLQNPPKPSLTPISAPYNHQASLSVPIWNNTTSAPGGYPPSPWDSQVPRPLLPHQRFVGLGNSRGVNQQQNQNQQDGRLIFGSLAMDIRNQQHYQHQGGVSDTRVVNGQTQHVSNYNAGVGRGGRADRERQQHQKQNFGPPRTVPPGFPQVQRASGGGQQRREHPLELSRQMERPGPPMGSNMHSVGGVDVEESTASLHRQVEELAGQFRGGLMVNDGFHERNGARQTSNLYQKEVKTDNRRLWTPGSQQIRNYRRDFDCRSDIDKMNAPFLAIFGSLVPAEEEKMKQKKLLMSLEKLVNKEWPRAQLYLYGSCANSFGVSKSDIDVCLSIEDLDISKAELLLKLADMLKLDNLENVQALTHARVPIVKLLDPESGISCDICVNNVLAVVNTKLLRDYAEIDNRLRQLAFIIKHWAKSRGVNETYRGTLSSYAYVLMCIHFLQQRRPAILPCLQGMEATYAVTLEGVNCAYFDKVEKLRDFGSRNRESISQLVWGFFDYWAYRHDYANSVISIRTGSILSKRAKDWTRRIGNDRHLICIEDPFEISHDLGRVVDKYSIKVLREEFERAAKILQHDRDPCVTLFEPYVPIEKKDDQL